MSKSQAPNNLPAIPAKLVEALQAARHIAVLTGAGISAEPAMPTNPSRYGYAYAYANAGRNTAQDCNS